MKITKIDPPYWFTDMGDDLQLMIYGEALSGSSFQTTIPCKKKEYIVKDVNSHYLIVYLKLEECVAPDSYSVSLFKDGQQETIPYEMRKPYAWNGDFSSITMKDVVYLLMPDRFARSEEAATSLKYINRRKSHSWHGGNIKGITEHLDYIEELGITTIWLTPIVENNMKPAYNEDRTIAYHFYHGYAATNFYAVDPHFGTLGDYAELVNAAHQRGMKVVMDVVFNHCGISHCWMEHHPQKNWFNILAYDGKIRNTNYQLATGVDPYAFDIDKEDTIKGWFNKKMPDLNFTNRHLFNYMLQMTIWWVASFGIDGYRVDTYPYVSLRCMHKWQERMHLLFPKMTIFAETWVSETAYTATIQKKYSDGDNVLAVMDFSFQKHMTEMVGSEGGSYACLIPYSHFAYDYLYKNANQTLAFLDNHDMPRWAFVYNEVQRNKQAIGMLLTVPRIPQLFYGTELMFQGKRGDISDGAFRQDFPGGWTEDKTNYYDTSKLKGDRKEIYEYVKHLLWWRRGCKAVTEGGMKQFVPKNGIYAYVREGGGERILVVVNCSDSEKSWELMRFKKVFGENLKGRDIITNSEFDLSGLTLTVNKHGILILKTV